ncbi:hypothetical protein DM02DRAFT_665483 [Periconia macrospinosa]|uniref:Uncharacterized protein n=1 Tax=Periconia macrospinosa TaxID=97972 RepID=A0A2V1CY75_9PLEO|nr:hypothetical protein DM02DRAFT_665483 [Periconia macrospinosa]
MRPTQRCGAQYGPSRPGYSMHLTGILQPEYKPLRRIGPWGLKFLELEILIRELYLRSLFIWTYDLSDSATNKEKQAFEDDSYIVPFITLPCHWRRDYIKANRQHEFQFGIAVGFGQPAFKEFVPHHLHKRYHHAPLRATDRSVRNLHFAARHLDRISCLSPPTVHRFLPF